MYICKECQNVFEEFAIEREIHDELESAPYEEFLVCPSCRSGSCEEAVECENCCEYFAPKVNGYYTDALGRLFCSGNCAAEYHAIRKVSA